MLLLLFSFLARPVFGANMITVLPNHGQVLSTSPMCNTADISKLQVAMFVSVRYDIEPEDNDSDQKLRGLQRSTYCGDACAGFEPDYCWTVFPECAGNGRRVLEEDDEDDEDDEDETKDATTKLMYPRNEDNGLSCEEEIELVATGIEIVKPLLSRKCKRLFSEEIEIVCTSNYKPALV